MNHTPEPWFLLDDRWLAAGTSPGQPYIADFNVSSHWRPPGTTAANAARAWACVNACQGIAEPASYIAALRATLRQALPIIDSYRKMSGGDGDICAANIRGLLKEAAPDAVSLTEIIRIHIHASGPVSFASIVAYAREQWSPETEEHVVARVLTDLMRSREVALYDDGVSFTSDKP